MTQWIFTSSLLIVAVLAVRALAGDRISARLRYGLWALVLLRLLIPVQLGSSPVSVLNLVSSPAVPTAQTAPMPVMPQPSQTEQSSQTTQTTQTEQTTSAIDEKSVLRLVYIIGAVGVGGVLLMSNLRFAAQLRRSRREITVHGCRLPVYQTDLVETPCLFGLVHPSVYVTPDLLTDGYELQYVLTHELTHHKHRDHIWSLLRCLCLCIHWYNPLVWLAAYLSKNDSEIACDEAVLATIGEEHRMAYGRTLVGMTCVGRGGLLTAATTMSGTEKSLKQRIVRIAKNPKMKKSALALAVVAVAVIAVCVFSGRVEQKDAITGIWRNNIVVDTRDEKWSGILEYTFRDGTGTEKRVLEDGTIFEYGFSYTLTDSEVQLSYDSGTEKAYEWSISDGWLLLRSKDNPYDAYILYTFDGQEQLVEYEFDPADAVGIVDAQLTVNGRRFSANTEGLGLLEELITTAEPIKGGTGCPFQGTLVLTMSDGRVLSMVPAVDSCAVFKIGDAYYEYGNQFEDPKADASYDNSELFGMFGLTAEEVLDMIFEARDKANGTLRPFGDGDMILSEDGTVVYLNSGNLLLSESESYASTITEEDLLAAEELACKDYEAWSSEDYCIRMNVLLSDVDEAESVRLRMMYDGFGDGWTKEYLAENFVAVRVCYDCELDHSKTFIDDGIITKYTLLVRDDARSPWEIWDYSSSD